MESPVPEFAVRFLVALLIVVAAPASADTAFSLVNVDSSNDVGEYLWLAVDDQGRPHLSYYDRTAGALRFAVRNGGTWSTRTIDGRAPGTDVGGYTFLEFDPAGNPHVVHYDWADGDLEHAWREDGVWSTETVDAGGIVGRYGNLRFDASGVAHVVYYDEGDGDFEYARNDGSGWQLETVDAGGDVGIKARMVIDAAGDLHAAYYDATNTALRYARRSGATWEVVTVDDGGGQDVGSYASIALDDDGRPWITYYNATTGNPEIAIPGGSGFTTQVIESSPGQRGWFTSLRFDRGGRPVVAYYDLTERKPVLARRVNGSWQVGFVEPTRDEGPHVALWIDGDTTARIAFHNDARQSLRYGETLLPVATETTSMGGLRARFGGVD
jgi:hypothetical protein